MTAIAERAQWIADESIASGRSSLEDFALAHLRHASAEASYLAAQEAREECAKIAEACGSPNAAYTIRHQIRLAEGKRMKGQL